MSEFGQELIVAMEGIAAHARRNANDVRVTTIEVPDVRAIPGARGMGKNSSPALWDCKHRGPQPEQAKN